MVYKRKRTSKRRMKKRMTKRIPRTISSVSKGVYFKRSYWSIGWEWNPTTTAGFWRRPAPSISSLPDIADFQNMFDEYKMLGVKITLHPRFQSVTAPAAAVSGSLVYQNSPYLTYAIDTTSSPNYLPTGAYSSSTYNNMLEECNNPKTRIFNKPISIYYKPKIQTDVTQGSSYSNSRMESPKWISFENGTQVPMWSTQLFIHDYNFNMTDTFQFSCDVHYTYYFLCRGQN